MCTITDLPILRYTTRPSDVLAAIARAAESTDPLRRACAERAMRCLAGIGTPQMLFHNLAEFDPPLAYSFDYDQMERDRKSEDFNVNIINIETRPVDQVGTSRAGELLAQLERGTPKPYSKMEHGSSEYRAVLTDITPISEPFRAFPDAEKRERCTRCNAKKEP